MADKVLFQTDDALSETNLAMWRARDNSADYVERGLSVTPDWTNAVVDVTAGHAVIKNGTKAYDVFTDSRTGLSLADSKGTNYLFLVMDPANQDDIWIEINADGAEPSKPSLLIQKVDASEEVSSPANRQPDASYGSFDADVVETSAQVGVADTFVTDTAGLESTFANLSPGETVRIAQPETPYRPSQWLDIDANHVTVIAETPFATDGQPLVKPADGSDVGGIRVGHNAATEHVHIEGVGFHGNDTTMSGTAKRLHGFVADQNASHVTFRNNYATRTHPYHEHNSGGSGFTVRKNASHVRLVDNRTNDIGDCGIQIAGTNTLIRGNVLTNGYGDSISLNVTDSDGKSHLAKNSSVVNNFGRDNSQGSLVGFVGPSQRSERGYFTIAGNVATGQHQKLVQLGNSKVDVKAISVVGNVGDGQAGEHVGIKSTVTTADSWVNITNNLVLGYSNGGVKITKGHNVNVSNNLVTDIGGPGITTTGWSNHNISGNIVRNASGAGIEAKSGMAPVTVAQNQVRFCNAQGVTVNQPDGNGFAIGASVYGNALDQNAESNSVPELEVQSGNVLAFANHVTTRGGSSSFADSGTGNLWVGNMAPADGSAWSLGSASGVQTMANRPNPAGKGFVLTSPNGTEYEVTVADDGSLNTTSL